MSPARTKLDGHYPQNKNELMVTKDILKACGNENLSVGDSLVLTYENNTGVHTDEFVISGIWDWSGWHFSLHYAVARKRTTLY